MNLKQAMAAVQKPDAEAVQAARQRWDSIAKPLHSLGLLEDAVVRLAGIQRTACPNIEKRCLVILCADNGVVDEGVAQTDREVTAAMTESFTRGHTCVCHMAASAGCDVLPVDIGVARDVDAPGLRVHKLAYGTRNMLHEPAMSRLMALEAVEYGISLAQELREDGFGLIATGEMGIGNTTTSSALTSVFLKQDPSDVTGKGAGLTGAGISHKAQVIRQAIALHRPDPTDALDVLHKVGGLDLAGMVGLYLGGAAWGLPILVDGFISAAAALAAVRLCPGVGDYLIASHVSGEPAGKMLLDALELRPFLTCGMCLGEGTGAMAALPILDMALAVYQNMSTFSDMKIEAYAPLT